MVYKQGEFKNNFEHEVYNRLFQSLRDTKLAFRDMYKQLLDVRVYHNIQTADVIGTSIDTVAFRKPLSREIDILIVVSQPRDLIILGSVKNTKRPVRVDELTDFKETVNSARSKPSSLVMAFAVSTSGFQSGCEHIAKEVDIALVPPITGDPYWFKTLSKNDILQKTEHALRLALLVTIRWYKRANYKSGDFYNEVYIVTREPSGLPSTTPILMADGTKKTMEEIFQKVIEKKLGRFALRFGETEYIPLEKPIRVVSMDKSGKKVQSKVLSISRRPRPKVPFVHLKTESGRELVCDPQRGFYVRCKGYKRLYRADRLKLGMKILTFDEKTQNVVEDTVVSLEREN